MKLATKSHRQCQRSEPPPTLYSSLITSLTHSPTHAIHPFIRLLISFHHHRHAHFQTSRKQILKHTRWFMSYYLPSTYHAILLSIIYIYRSTSIFFLMCTRVCAAAGSPPPPPPPPPHTGTINHYTARGSEQSRLVRHSRPGIQCITKFKILPFPIYFSKPYWIWKTLLILFRLYE